MDWLILALMWAVIIFIMYYLFVFPIRLKRQFIRLSKEFKPANVDQLRFKISFYGYAAYSLLVILVSFFITIPLYFGSKYPPQSTGVTIFLVFSVLLGLTGVVLGLRMIFFVLPKTFVDFSNGHFIYYFGLKETLNTTVEGITEIDYQEYFRTFYWCLVVKTKEAKEARVDILLFERPKLLHALLVNRNLRGSILGSK